MNRLAGKLLWWKHAWFFHWAHKPLCEHYAEDVLRLGKLRLCRGCTMLWAGLVLGLAILFGSSPESGMLVAGFAAGFGAAAVGSHPALHSRWPRPVRDLLRLAAGASLAHVLALLLLGHLLPGGALAALLVLTYLLYARLRRGRRLARCESCVELGARVCSGYALQAGAIREWEEAVVTRLVTRGYRPDS